MRHTQLPSIMRGFVCLHNGIILQLCENIGEATHESYAIPQHSKHL